MRRAVFLSMVIGSLIAPAIQAAIVVDQNDDVRITDWGPRNDGFNGGPFIVEVWDDATANVASHTSGTGFLRQLSFCVQTNSNLSSFGTTYNIAGLSVKTTENNLTRELSGYAMWVFKTFTQLGLTPNTTSLPAGVDTTDLENYQKAIWAGVITTGLEVKATDLGNSTTSLQSLTGSLYVTTKNTSGQYVEVDISPTAFASVIGSNVELFDPTKGTWKYDMENGPAPYQMMVITGSQDQVFIGTGKAGIVPEPASIAIWSLIGGLGVAGAAIKRRKVQHGRWSNENRQAILSIVDSAR